MAENLDISLAKENISEVVNTPNDDVNIKTSDNLKESAGKQLQETLFWDYQNNQPPNNLPKSTYPSNYPNLIGGGGDPSSKGYKRKSWDEIAKESLTEVRQKQGGIGRSVIHNPGDKISRYDVNKHNAVGYLRGADNEKIHYDLLSNVDRAMIGVRNAALKASTVAVAGLGYIGKLPIAALNGDVSSAGDNWLSNWATEMGENPINQIYLPPGYENLSALEQLGTGTWWATQGADMAGFVAGNLLPATFVSKLGLLAKGSKLVGNALYANKAKQLAGVVPGASALGTELTGISKLGYNLANNNKWISSMSMLETGFTSSVTEAIFEGVDSKKRIYQDLLKKGYTPEKALEVATENANLVIGLNTALTLPGSFFEINALLKGGSNLAAAAKYIREGGLATKPTVGNYAKSMLAGAVEGAIIEGVWEENVQGSIQTLADKLSTGKIDSGVGNIFESLITDSINNFSTHEGQESIVGGMVMGILMGGWKGAKELRNNYKTAEKIYPKYQSSYTSQETLAKDLITLSNYMKDKSNYIMMKDGMEDLDENGIVKVNTAKLISDVKSLGLTVDLTNTLTNAAEKGDYNLQDIAKSQLIGEFVYNHISNGLSDRLFDKLAAFQNMSEEEKVSLGIVFPETDANGNTISFNQQINKIKEKAVEYKDLYNHIESFFPEVLSKDKEGNEYGFDTRAIFREAVLNKSILNTLNEIDAREVSVREQMIANVNQNIKNRTGYLQLYLNNKKDTANPFSVEVNPDAMVNAYIEANPNSPLTKEYNQLDKKKTEYQEVLSSSNKRYVKLTDKESVSKHIVETIQSKEKAEEIIKNDSKITNELNNIDSEIKKTEEEKQRLIQERDNLTKQIEETNPVENSAEREDLVKKKAEVEAEISKKTTEELANKQKELEKQLSSQSLMDLMANAGDASVDELDPSMVTPEDGSAVPGNPRQTKPIRPSDSLNGATPLEKAQEAFSKIMDHYNNEEQSTSPVERFGLDKMTAEEMLAFYDNLFGNKTEGSQINFKGRILHIGDRYKGNDDIGTIWKVKGVDVQGDLLMYAASDAIKTTKITSLEQLDQMENLSKKAEEKNDKKESTTPQPLEAGLPVNKEVSNVFRIPNGNTFLEVYQNSYSMVKEEVNRLLTRMNPDQIAEQVYVVFERESIQSILKTADELFQPQRPALNIPPNPNLWQKRGTKFRFKIMFGNEIIGYGTNPNKYVIFDQNKNKVSPENLDINLFNQIYDTNQKNPITLDQFKQSYKDSLKLYTELYNRLGDKDQVTLSIAEVTELLNFRITPGEYDYSVDKQYKLSELDYNTIEGEVYVLDMQNIYEPGTGKVIGRTVTPNVSDPLKQDLIDQAIMDTFGGPINTDILRSYGRYVSVIQLPNKNIKFVELSTPALTEEEGGKLLQSLRDRQKESFNNINQEESSKVGNRIPISNTFNDGFNDAINNEVFISVKDKKGIDVSLGLTPTGILRIEISDYSDPISPKDTTLYINRDLDEIKNISDLREAINSAIDKHNSSNTKKVPFKLENKSFKKSISKNATTDDFLNMQTSVNPNIVKNVSLEIEVKDFKQTPYVKDNNKVIVPQTITQSTITVKQQEVINKLQPLSEKTFEVNGNIYVSLDENGTPQEYKRVSSRAGSVTPSARMTDASNRGTIVDSLLRSFVEGNIVSKEDLIAEYQNNPLSNETTEFSEGFLNNLYDIFQEVSNKTKGMKLISNIPTLWGKLDGENYAGTIDLLGIALNGDTFIIDLKTSNRSRREDYNKPDSESLYKAKDKSQQNDYADLLFQRTGINVKKITIFPITTKVANGVYNNASTEQGSDNKLTIEVPRITGPNTFFDDGGQPGIERTPEVSTIESTVVSDEATNLKQDIDIAKFLLDTYSDGNFSGIPNDFIYSGFVERILNMKIGKDSNDRIKEALLNYINTYSLKTEKIKPVVISTAKNTDVIERIKVLKNLVDQVKQQGKDKTLLNENGEPFTDNKSRNTYGKKLIDGYNAEIKVLQEKLPKDINSALKLINSESTVKSRTTLNEFKDFLKRNLPVYIDVQDIDTLMDNISNKGLALGIFQTNIEIVNGIRKVVGGTIGTKEENAFKYHEAFHAVFRLLLPEAKIKSLLKEAKSEYASVLKSKNITLETAIKQFKESSSLYATLSDKQAEERLYEEYMADKFDEWKINKAVKTSSNIKNFFKKLIDWFRAFSTRIGLSKQDMMGLFEDINKGKYKNSKIQANRFTETQERLEEGLFDSNGRPIDGLFPTNSALKLIKVGQEETIDEFGNMVLSPKYLTQSQSNKLVGTVVAVFLRRYQEFDGNLNDLINQIMDDYANLYDSNSDSYTERDDYFEIVDNLDEFHFAYSDPESRQALIENINYSLQQLGFKQSEDEQSIEDDVDELGDRQVGNYTIETSSIGGFGSLSKFLRRYIASTTYPIVDDKGQSIPDQFGNYELIPGEPLVEAVDSNVVYNGILKALANVNDQVVFVNRLVEYAQGNEQSAHFIQRFISDTGLKINEDGTFDISKNPTLFQMVVKGFNQYRVDYIFSQKDPKSKVSKIFLANQKDVAQTQFDLWFNSFTTLYQDKLDKISDPKEKVQFIADRKKVLDRLRSYLSIKKKTSEPDINKLAEQQSIELNAAYGIALSKNYIKYSIIAGIDPENRTAKQNKYFNAFNSVLPLTQEDLEQISKTVQKQANPFVKGQIPTSEVTQDESGALEDIEVDIEVDDSNIGRLKKIAENNAIFDETVGSSSFVNAEGKTVYGHQLPTFHLISAVDLNNKNYRKNLKKDPYLKNNYLSNSELFENIAEKLKVKRIDGLRQVTFSQDTSGRYYENKSLDVNKREGVVYGDYSEREFLLNLFDLYLYQEENSITRTTKDGKKIEEKFNTSLHLIRVLEASNTGDTIALPINKLFEKGNINETATNALVNEIVNEYERIQRVKKEIEEIKKGIKKEGIIQDYHNGKLRGLKFFKTANMLGPLRSELENNAQKEKDYKLTPDQISQIKDQVKDYFRNQVNNLLDNMVEQNILQGSREKGYSNILLPLEIERGVYIDGKYNPTASEKMGLNDNIIDNVGQIFMNDFLNTLAYNQLILGDSSKGLKDSVDEVKRAKGANGSGPSIEAKIIAPELGINHPFVESHIGIIAEPQSKIKLSANKAENTVDRADAQMWLTVKGLRYTLFGLGKLNEKNARFLDKIENGETITKEDVFGDNGSLQYDGQTNSIKLVYYDGKKYIKTSGVILQKELTSYLDGETWKPIPGREDLHDMREKMEDFEGRNNTVMFMVPKSASKAISEDIMKTDLSDFSDGKMKPLANKFWRLQLENPSNKLVINDPTQAKQLIDMEQDDSTEVLFRGTKISIGQLKSIYQDASEQRVKNNYIKARNTIFNIDEAFSELQSSIDQNKVSPKLAEFQSRAIETLQASGADSQLLGFFELDEQGNPKYNLNMPLTLDKYTQLFLAYFSKGVTNEKTPGHAVALMSDYGMQLIRQVTEVDPDTKRPTKWKTIRSSEFKQNPNKYHIKDPETENMNVGDYYVSDLQYNVPEYNNKGEIVGYYSEFMLPPHFADLMDIKPGDPISDAVAKAFGVRIPSQDKHSFISLKLVDFLPANMGSTGIFPKELVTLSGADFDIDKLYMSIASWFKKGDSFVRYGDEAFTPQEKFDEFLHYELNNNKDLKKLIKKKLKANKDYNDLKNDLKLYNASLDGQDIIEGIEEDYQSSLVSWDDVLSLKPDDVTKYISGKISELKKVVINESLTELGLPSTINEFEEKSKTTEINNGVLNNIILDAKIQFLTNDHIRPEIAVEAAGVDLLKDLTSDPDLAPSVIQEVNLDTDSILGKTAAFKNNKEGANNIGPAVNSMLIYSLLNKYKIKLRNSSNSSNEKNTNNYPWAKNAPNNYEVSSIGDKRFSALNAKLSDGRTIEEAYQLDIKGYREKGNNWKLGKGKPPLNNISKEESWSQYKALWVQWANENPNLIKELSEKAKGKTLTDKFASTEISQARALSEILESFNTKQKTNSENEIYKLIIDGNIYDGYDKSIDISGNRIMNSISTVVSAMTDNAKERLAAKLNISSNAVAPLCNMLAQGVPIKTAISILLQPSVKEYFAAIKRFSNKFNSTEDRMFEGQQINKSDISKALLDKYSAAIPEDNFDVNYKLTTNELLATTRGELDNPMLQWKVLSDYIKIENQTSYFSAPGQIIKLAKGLGTNFEYGDGIIENMEKLGLLMTDEEFNKSNIPFDVRQILTGEDESKPYHKITANYIKIFNQINELAKSLFIEKTNTFKRIKDIVFSNMDFSKDEFNIKEESIKMKRNLISYLSFKAYQKLMIDENKSSRLTSLSNKLLYDLLDTDNSYKDITERLEEARRLAPNNYLLNRFLIKNSTTVKLKGEIKENKNNKDGINKIESNTWARISNSMVEKLQDSFRELYNDPNTKQYAIDLFNYLIVKDGLQFKSGSFLKLIPNFMFYDMLRGTTKANEIMKLDTKSLSQKELDEKYKEVFNLTQAELFNNFTDIYLSNINNAFHIPQITKIVKNNVEKPSIKYTNNLQNELVIDIFAAVRNETINEYMIGDKWVTEVINTEGKLEEVEKDRFVNNLQDIKESGFIIDNVIETDGTDTKKRLKVNFPYVITVPKGNKQKAYYKLVRVDNKRGKVTESKASNFISRSETMAKGTKAVYQEIKLKGSRAQTSIGGVFGELPNSESLRRLNKKDLQRSTNLEDTNPSIMGDQTTSEFNNSLNNIFGVSSDGTTTISEKQLPPPPPDLQKDVIKGESEKLNTASDAASIFYSAVNDNFDMSTLDSSFFKDESENDIADGMKGMDVTDGQC